MRPVSSAAPAVRLLDQAPQTIGRTLQNQPAGMG
jgi:hypothetical protein